MKTRIKMHRPPGSTLVFFFFLFLAQHIREACMAKLQWKDQHICMEKLCKMLLATCLQIIMSEFEFSISNLI